MINCKLLNRRKRQYARHMKTERLLLSQFIHTLNNKLCAIQGITQLYFLDESDPIKSVNKIESIIFNIVDNMRNLQSSISPFRIRRL